MISEKIRILLADDDKDDCFLFTEALSELPLSTHLTTVSNGEQLCQWLYNDTNEIPDVVFLDLNMPRKNGFQCLDEIKKTERFKSLPVIIYSTSFDDSIANQLYRSGAHFYICKPPEFSLLKYVIQKTLELTCISKYKPYTQPPRDKFVIKLLQQVP